MGFTYKVNNMSAGTYHRQLNWYRFKAQTQGFHSMIKYENYFICIVCVFMNINKNVRK